MFKFEYDYMRITAISIICITLLFLGLMGYCYKINSKFIENGYQSTMTIGYDTPIWQKIK